jgi:hypothetical protein
VLRSLLQILSRDLRVRAEVREVHDSGVAHPLVEWHLADVTPVG